ncbi:DNA topoisomerase 2 isoform X2 [Rhizophagus clarus]|uniref:DNA topoisomerase (ATP-hydrolyzing) n=1 Tax=Rhizophagus clarus TaxID=94130 RepID=A0A8H3QK99_9GLOM|nr:DNA topoisomerase 2 isoform X2 [Rhizophagus clarus]
MTLLVQTTYGVGQFGTKSQDGKDAASARYISVTVPSLTRLIFHPQDDILLTYCNDDGQIVEPEWYLPIISMILVNGTGVSEPVIVHIFQIIIHKILSIT